MICAIRTVVDKPVICVDLLVEDVCPWVIKNTERSDYLAFVIDPVEFRIKASRHREIGYLAILVHKRMIVSDVGTGRG